MEMCVLAWSVRYVTVADIQNDGLVKHMLGLPRAQRADMTALGAGARYA